MTSDPHRRRPLAELALCVPLTDSAVRSLLMHSASCVMIIYQQLTGSHNAACATTSLLVSYKVSRLICLLD